MVTMTNDAGGYGTRVYVYDEGHAGDTNHLRGMRESFGTYMYHVSPTKILHFGGLDTDKKFDLVVRPSFHREEFTVQAVEPGRRIKIDCSNHKVTPWPEE